MTKSIIFKEHHNFFKFKGYLSYVLFLIMFGYKSGGYFQIIFINIILSLFYFLLVDLFNRKKIVINANLIKKGNRRLPSKGITYFAHNGTYLYLLFLKKQYVKIYDPNKRLTNLILINYNELCLSKNNIKHLLDEP